MLRALIVMFLLVLASCASVEEQYQHDADIYRLRHLAYYGGLIQEYESRTGSFPFYGASENELQVTFVTDEQREYLNENNRGITVIDQEAFRTELQRVLERPIELRFDPQRVPVTMPIYYLYVVDGEDYFFIMHLYNEYPFSANRGQHFNQIEITNSDIDHPGFWRYSDLIENPAFIAAIERQPTRTGWFDHLESEHK